MDEESLAQAQNAGHSRAFSKSNPQSTLTGKAPALKQNTKTRGGSGAVANNAEVSNSAEKQQFMTQFETFKNIYQEEDMNRMSQIHNALLSQQSADSIERRNPISGDSSSV